MCSNPVAGRCIDMCAIGQQHFCCGICGCCGCCHASCCACWVTWSLVSAKMTWRHTRPGECATMSQNTSLNSRVKGKEHQTKNLTLTMLLQCHCNEEQTLQCHCNNCPAVQCVATAMHCNVLQLQHVFSWVCTDQRAVHVPESVFCFLHKLMRDHSQSASRGCSTPSIDSFCVLWLPNTLSSTARLCSAEFLTQMRLIDDAFSTMLIDSYLATS